MSTKSKLLIGFGVYILGCIVIVVATGWHRSQNNEFHPQNEFKLDTWFSIGPIDFNKAVMYILIAAILTVWTMVFIARRMQARPNRVQTAVEVLFALMRDNITRGNMDQATARKWFPFVGTLFLFIWYSNLIGYIPLPTNTEHKIDVFGVQFPSFSLYAATANLAIPLALAVLLGIAALGWITIPAGVALFLFEVGLVATLQAFIFATLTAIYLGGAVSQEGH